MYPFSITRNVKIKHDNHKDILQLCQIELKKLNGVRLKKHKNKIDILECEDFTSRGLHRFFKELNYGRIDIKEKDGYVYIDATIYLFEHLTIFSLIILISIFNCVFINNEFPDNNGLMFILTVLIANMVWLYILPLMTFYNFIDNVINESKISLVENKKNVA